MSGYCGPVFFYQLGHQDQTCVQEMLEAGFNQGLIMSPKHLTIDKFAKHSENFCKLTDNVIIDPQGYNPQFTHSEGYPGYPALRTIGDLITPDVENEVRNILGFQLKHGNSFIIVPYPYRQQITKKWLRGLKLSAEIANRWKQDTAIDREMLVSVPLSASALIDSSTRYELLDYLVTLRVKGFYLTCEAPRDQLLPDSEEYLIGLMDLVFRLKQHDFYLIFGYSSYESLLLFPFGLDCYASGGFDNRRRFDFSEWEPNDEESTGGPPAVKFWDEKLLDYVRFPDDALLLQTYSLWGRLASESPFSSQLFSGSDLTAIAGEWKRKASWKHYYYTCNSLANEFVNLEYKQRINRVYEILDRAIDFHQNVAKQRVPLQRRSSHPSVWKTAFTKYIQSVERELLFRFA